MHNNNFLNGLSSSLGGISLLCRWNVLLYANDAIGDYRKQKQFRKFIESLPEFFLVINSKAHTHSHSTCGIAWEFQTEKIIVKHTIFTQLIAISKLCLPNKAKCSSCGYTQLCLYFAFCRISTITVIFDLGGTYGTYGTLSGSPFSEQLDLAVLNKVITNIMFAVKRKAILKALVIKFFNIKQWNNFAAAVCITKNGWYTFYTILLHSFVLNISNIHIFRIFIIPHPQ